jgi:hypothetical protein
MLLLVRRRAALIASVTPPASHGLPELSDAELSPPNQLEMLQPPPVSLPPSGSELWPDDPRFARRFCNRVISTRQISELTPTAIPNAAIALVTVSCRAEPQDGAGWCVAKRQRPGQCSARNVAIPFIDHSSEMWNFRL